MSMLPKRKCEHSSCLKAAEYICHGNRYYCSEHIPFTL